MSPSLLLMAAALTLCKPNREFMLVLVVLINLPKLPYGKKILLSFFRSLPPLATSNPIVRRTVEMNKNCVLPK